MLSKMLTVFNDNLTKQKNAVFNIANLNVLIYFDNMIYTIIIFSVSCIYNKLAYLQ